MKLKVLCLLLSALPVTYVQAAALDRSGQSILPILQDGNYFEAGFTVLDPTVSGKVKPEFTRGGLTAARNMNTGDIANSYYFPSAALKVQINDYLSASFLYDHPFGADATYPQQQYDVYTQTGQDTEAQVRTQSFSSIIGIKPNNNFLLYAGPVIQTVKGDVQLRGAGYNYIRYNLSASSTTGYGWLAGVAYSIPEIALKAAITYRSKIDHDINMHETVSALNPVSPALGYINFGSSDLESTITTPQSVNLDFQTGIMQDTVLFANARWVQWSDFKISPQRLGQLTTQLTGKPVSLVSYSKDQYSANLGVGRKFNPFWSGSISVGWDSGAGNPVSTLGPTEGYKNIGLGIKYSPAPNYDIALGAKYFWLGDAKAQSAFDAGTKNYDAIYTNNHAMAYGLKIGYHF